MNRWEVYFIITSVVLIILLTAVPLSLAVQKQKPSQPDQPNFGPGGADYQYSGVKVTTYGGGQISTGYLNQIQKLLYLHLSLFLCMDGEQ